VIERFDAPMPALMRHGEVAKRLREHGWTVIDRVGAATIRSAA
jgi:hypothetical protein